MCSGDGVSAAAAPAAAACAAANASRGGAIASQHLFSVYIHAPPAFEGYEPESLWAGRLVRHRVTTSWGAHTLVEATRHLLWEAFRDPLNSRFLLLSESDIPLYDPLTLYQQLQAEAVSRLDTCRHHSTSQWRWDPRMEVSGRPVVWRSLLRLLRVLCGGGVLCGWRWCSCCSVAICALGLMFNTKKYQQYVPVSGCFWLFVWAAAAGGALVVLAPTPALLSPALGPWLGLPRFVPPQTPKLKFHMWRKSPQWLSLTRPHVALALRDEEVYRKFERHCWSAWDAANARWHRDCFSDEHYFATVRARARAGGRARGRLRGAWRGLFLLLFCALRSQPQRGGVFLAAAQRCAVPRSRALASPPLPTPLP